jgi:hypothetical protein
MNINSSLLMGLAMQHAQAKHGDALKLGDIQAAELRIYEPGDGSGFWFVRASSPGRWYYMPESGSDGFQRADLDAMGAAVAAGARVQFVGYHGRSLALWHTWEDFEHEMDAL